MVFYISVRSDRRNVRLKVERVYLSSQLEKYLVSGKNKSIVIQGNRPLLRARGLKTRRPDWKLVEGQLHNTYLLGEIIKTVESYLKAEEKKQSLTGPQTDAEH